MTKIQRYEMNHKGLPEPDDNGVWVFRKEHDTIVDAQQEQVQKLAAEVIYLRSAHPQPFGREMMKAIDAYIAKEDETPESGMLDAFFILRDSIVIKQEQSDAVVREIGAKAVEGFGDVLGLGSLHLALILKKCAYEHAAKLRSGEQP